MPGRRFSSVRIEVIFIIIIPYFSCRAIFVQLGPQSLNLAQVVTIATLLESKEAVTVPPVQLVNTAQAWVTQNQLAFVMLVSIAEELHLLL